MLPLYRVELPSLECPIFPLPTPDHWNNRFRKNSPTCKPSFRHIAVGSGQTRLHRNIGMSIGIARCCESAQAFLVPALSLESKGSCRQIRWFPSALLSPFLKMEVLPCTYQNLVLSIIHPV